MLYVLDTHNWGFFVVAESPYDALAMAQTAAPACEKAPQECRIDQVHVARQDHIDFYCAT